MQVVVFVSGDAAGSGEMGPALFLADQPGSTLPPLPRGLDWRYLATVDQRDRLLDQDRAGIEDALAGALLYRQQVDTMTHEPDTIVRHRAPRIDVVETRLATSALRPIVDRIPYWQASAARLLARAERVKRAGQMSPHDEEELEALESVVRVQRDQLRASLLTAPDAVRHHGRVEDTFRSIERLLVVTETARALFRGSRRLDG